MMLQAHEILSSSYLKTCLKDRLVSTLRVVIVQFGLRLVTRT